MTKRRRTVLVDVDDTLAVAKWFAAYGRDLDDEIRVYVSGGVVTDVTVGDRECVIALADLQARLPAERRMSFIWKWMRSQYMMRTQVGGML